MSRPIDWRDPGTNPRPIRNKAANGSTTTISPRKTCGNMKA